MVSEELTSEDEQLRYNKKACMMERVDEETEDPDALAESTRVQGSMATSKVADRPRKGILLIYLRFGYFLLSFCVVVQKPSKLSPSI